MNRKTSTYPVKKILNPYDHNASVYLKTYNPRSQGGSGIPRLNVKTLVSDFNQLLQRQNIIRYIFPESHPN